MQLKAERMTITNEDNMVMMARYPDNHFDLAIVDPPYGLERMKKNTNSKMTTFGDEDKNWNNIKPTKEYFDELFRVSKYQIIWGANNFELPPSEYFLCWNKEQAMPNFATLEYAWVSNNFKKPAKLFTANVVKANHKNKQNGGKIHPTQKPVCLYEWLLLNYAKEGDKILDTHLGSGSIAIACHNFGFELTACELDEEYYNRAMQRIEDHKAQFTLF